jgi:hypothetical protein
MVYRSPHSPGSPALGVFSLFFALLALLTFGFPETGLGQIPSPEQGTLPRNIVAFYDASGSMSEGANRAALARAKAYMLNIIYDGRPVVTNSADTVVSDRWTENGLLPGVGLYRDQDVLTYATFGKDINYKIQRERNVNRHTLEKNPPPPFPEQISRITYVMYKAYGLARFGKETTYFIRISDDQEDRRDAGEDTEREDSYLIDRLREIETKHPLESVYHLLVNKYVHIRVFRLGDAEPLPPPSQPETEPTPPEHPFQVVEQLDPRKQVQTLMFGKEPDGKNYGLKAEYAIALARDAKPGWQISKLTAVVTSGTHGRLLAVPKAVPMTDGTGLPVKIPKFLVPENLINPDNKIRLRIKYGYHRKNSGYLYTTPPLDMLPDIDPFQIRKEGGYALSDCLDLNVTDQGVKGSPLIIYLKRQFDPKKVKISSIRWIEASGPAQMEFVLPKGDKFPMAWEPIIERDVVSSCCYEAVKGQLEIAYTIEGVPKGLPMRIPLAVKVFSTGLSAMDFKIKQEVMPESGRSSETQDIAGKPEITLAWDPATLTLGVSACKLNWTDRTKRPGIALQQATLTMAGEKLWEGTLETEKLGQDVTFKLSREMSERIWKSKENTGLLQIRYKQGESVQSTPVLIPVAIRIPDSPFSDPFILTDKTDSKKAIGEVRFKWTGNSLELPPVYLVANPTVPEMFIGHVTGVDLVLDGRSFDLSTAGGTSEEMHARIPGKAFVEKRKVAANFTLRYRTHRSEKDLSQDIPLIAAIPPPPPLDPFLVVKNPEDPKELKDALPAKPDYADGSLDFDPVYLVFKSDTEKELFVGLERVALEIADLKKDLPVTDSTASSPLAYSIKILQSEIGKLPAVDPLEAKIVVWYTQKGVRETRRQDIPISLRVMEAVAPPTTLPILLVVCLILGLSVLYYLLRGNRRSKADTFGLISSGGAMGAGEYESITLRKDQKLALCQRDDGDVHSSLLNCPGSYIVNMGKGRLKLFAKGKLDPVLMSDAEEYKIETQDGGTISIRISWVSKPETEELGETDSRFDSGHETAGADSDASKKDNVFM